MVFALANHVMPATAYEWFGTVFAVVILGGLGNLLGTLYAGVGVGVAGLFNTSFLIVIMATVLFWITQATSWNILSGYAGYFSFGQGAYLGVGVYAMAVLTGRHGVPYL